MEYAMKPRIIYITGQAYSGSTFLCALLGMHPQAEPVSELSKWTTHYYKFNRYCSCGKKSIECSFWKDVENDWLTKNVSLKRYIELQNLYEHINNPFLFGRQIHNKVSFLEYQNLTEALFYSLVKVSNKNIIIDSSKRPGRGFALSNMNGLDVSIIHLVRNGYRYLESSLQRGRRISIKDPNLLYETFHLGLSWSMTNFMAEKITKNNKYPSLRIKYEDLIDHPIETLDRIGSVLNLDISAIQKHINNNLPIEYKHIATGSGHRRRGDKPISKEFNSLGKINEKLKFAFTLGAFIQLKRYGYI
jgi:hypothetical protein